MYDLPDYKEKNPQIIREFVDRLPFAFLSGCDAENWPVATQVPVYTRTTEKIQFAFFV